MSLEPYPPLVNRGGAFLLNPPAPHNPPTSFRGLSSQYGIGHIPQPSFAPSYRLSVNGPRNGSIFNADGWLAGEWLLIGGYAEPSNYYAYAGNYPYFIAWDFSRNDSLRRRWDLFYGRPRAEAGPYYIPGATSQFAEDWYLVGLNSQKAPHRIYRLWGTIPQDEDLEPIPVPPNEFVSDPPYDEENDYWNGYQEARDHNFARNFRNGGESIPFDYLGDTLFRIVPVFRGSVRESRIHERADNEYLKLRAFFP